MKIMFPIILMLFSTLAYCTPGVIVLAGGGTEGDIGVNSDWSYNLFKKLVENGDVTGDKKIKVVVISLKKPETNFMADYFLSMGATTSENLIINSKMTANDPNLINTLKDTDVIFFRGGNQGKAYQYWKDSLLQKEIKALADRGGAIGGTSAGAMGLSEYSITGGEDFATKDILGDAKSPLLNDEILPKTSGIHNDFLNLVPGVLVDTHCAERGRIGRLLGVKAKAEEDFKNKNILGICIEEKTGLVIQNNTAEVFGTGSVHFVQDTDETLIMRKRGMPLLYTDIRDDALTEGWKFDLNKNLPDLSNLPKNTIVIKPNYLCGNANKKMTISGHPSNELSIQKAQDSTNIIIANDAFSEVTLSGGLKRGVVQTNALQEIYNHPEASLILLAAESKIVARNENEITSSKNTDKLKKEYSSMILDCKLCSHKSLSPFISNQDNGTSTLHSPALINMRIHLINSETSYNVKTHQTQLIPIKDKRNSSIGDCEKRNLASLESIEFLNMDQQKIIEQMDCN